MNPITTWIVVGIADILGLVLAALLAFAGERTSVRDVETRVDGSGRWPDVYVRSVVRHEKEGRQAAPLGCEQLPETVRRDVRCLPTREQRPPKRDASLQSSRPRRCVSVVTLGDSENTRGMNKRVLGGALSGFGN